MSLTGRIEHTSKLNMSFFKTPNTPQSFTPSLQKGELADNLRWNSDITFEKTGKQIKEAVETILPDYTVRRDAIKKQLDKAYNALRTKPQDDCYYSSDTYNKKIPKLKIFKYWELYTPAQIQKENAWRQANSIPDLGTDSDTVAQSDEEAVERQTYNDTVYQYLNVATDTAALELLSNHLSDGKSYKLTPKIMWMLGFE